MYHLNYMTPTSLIHYHFCEYQRHTAHQLQRWIYSTHLSFPLQNDLLLPFPVLYSFLINDLSLYRNYFGIMSHPHLSQLMSNLMNLQ